ncbi:hypothetical protein AU468_04235 [Alkalispirochaeta sphaeroplastigenens]|uniref:Tetratricopeptide repeat protein n=1 Tax=Alkalispirochaeta sphaeroplastigenens TaxID=1187066 RepID=A0A2S4JX05_9SPIO|nr:tetratricopeptide repeat protein [Alkalispirochaeta sphaeroplastigenens]POR04030.1 hypothetical protein AU468_04235 [Alkalispirochaeta sphaeroplastigenens]
MTTNKKFGLAVLILGIFLLGSCAHMFTKGGGAFRAGDRAFEQGKYAEAVEHALNALESNPDFEEARDLLGKAFRTGTTTYESTIAQKKASSEPFRWDGIWKVYATLEEMHRAVAASPYSKAFDVKSYAEPLAEAREAAATERYAAGVEALGAGGFRNARIAVEHFTKAAEAIPGYQDLNDQMAQAREQAVSRVVVTANSDAYGELLKLVEGTLSSQETYVAIDLVQANHSLPEARDRFSSSHDFLIYMDVDKGSGSVVDNSNTPMVEGGKVVRRETRGFTHRYNVAARLIDLSNGSEIVSENHESTSTHSISYNFLYNEREERLNLDGFGGAREYRIVDMTASEYEAMAPVIRRMRAFVRDTTAEDITSITSLAELEQKIDGILLIRGPHVIARPVEGGAVVYYPLFTDDWDEHLRLGQNTNRLGVAISNHVRALVDQGRGDFSTERSAAARAVAAAMRGKL